MVASELSRDELPTPHSFNPTPGFQATLWRASIAAHPYQDNYLVASQGNALRLAVIDGVTPTVRTPRYGALDGAVWAARQIRQILATNPEPLPVLAQEVSTRLCLPHLASRDRPQATLAALDLHPNSGHTWSGQALRAGDCELWELRHNRWISLFPNDMLYPPTRAILNAWLKSHPASSQDERQLMEESLLCDQADWRTTALGRFPHPSLEQVSLEPGWQALVLASDGARLTSARVGELSTWMKNVRSWEAAKQLSGDDITVLRLAPVNIEP